LSNIRKSKLGAYEEDDFVKLTEEGAVKFVSMIDQKPIQPSYLQLVPMKNFAKKEQEAQRNE